MQLISVLKMEPVVYNFWSAIFVGAIRAVVKVMEKFSGILGWMIVTKYKAARDVKSLQMVTVAIKLKDAYSLEGKL